MVHFRPGKRRNQQRARRRRALVRPAPRGLLLAAVAIAMLIFVPLALTLWRAFGYGLVQAVDLLWRPIVLGLATNTLRIALCAPLLCGVIGTACAWCIERTELPGRRIWGVLVAVPLAIPPFITGFTWVSISDQLQDFGGALLVVSSAYYPLVYLPVAAALRGLDPALEESARSLGLGRFACFWRVTLPQLKPALLGGMLLVALGTLSEFGAFAMLRFHTFTTEIFAEYRVGFDGAGAALLASVLMVACLLLLKLEHRVRGHARYERLGVGARRALRRSALGHWKWPVMGGLTALVLVALVIPLGTIVYWMFQHGEAAVSPAEVSPELLLEATLSSVQLGLAGAALTTLLAIPLGFMLARYPSRRAMLIERTVFMAQGVPGIVIALAMVSLTIHVLTPLYQSATLLVVVYATLFLPLALVSVKAALLQAEERLENVGRSLGLGHLAVLLRVVLPIAAPGLGAAACMVFIGVVTELTATLMLAPIGTDTLATQIWADTSALAFAAAAPYSAILVAISLASAWALTVFAGKSAILEHAQRRD
jgi:iron(III) transport system permease protein